MLPEEEFFTEEELGTSSEEALEDQIQERSLFPKGRAFSFLSKGLLGSRASQDANVIYILA